jgi:nitronate monooxygenase
MLFQRKEVGMSNLPKLKIKGFELPLPIVQGGMGVGVSRHPLANASAKNGILGIVSSAGLRFLVTTETNIKQSTYDATRYEIERSKGNGPIGINIMCALVQDYEETVKGAIDAGADVIISGAGLPLGLPSIKPPGNTALIPIVSSARALDLILKRWEKVHYRPDAVVVEGHDAGGHLGFKFEDIGKPEFALENLLPPILDLVSKHGNFPVIVAGGIYTNSDILKFLKLGASGVQLGTRFLATVESSASDAYKQAVVDATSDDICVVSMPDHPPASPCGLPFRVLTSSPAYRERREPKCNKGYVLRRDANGLFSLCPAKPGPGSENYLCICNGLSSSAGRSSEEPALYTVGTNAYRVNKILPVAELVKELSEPEII